MSNQDLDKVLSKFSVEYEADVLLFSADISSSNADHLIQLVSRIPNPQSNVCLILTTPGGSPDATYLIARCLQRNYKKFLLFVFGFCKSAGTLLALGAEEIVMSDYGEFGPLDVQVSVTDNLVGSSSGLDIEQALNVISARTFEAFEQYFTQLIQGSQGLISTKTAADIASSMAVNLFTPVAAPIDPLRLGEMNRVLQIAEEYGDRLSTRLGAKTIDDKRLTAIRQLTSGYPAHSFVIDREEASTWLENVRSCQEIDDQLARILFSVTRYPVNMIKLLYPTLHDANPSPEENAENTKRDTESADSSGFTQRSASKNDGANENTESNLSSDYQANSAQ